MGLTGSVLAIDAGNSKTDVLLVADDGTVRGTARGGGFHPPVVGAESAVAGLAPLVAATVNMAAAGVPSGGLRTSEAGAPAGATGSADGPWVADHMSACLANVDLPTEEERLSQELAARPWTRSVTVANDTFALLRAGLPDGDEPAGVAVVCGAGINCAGLAPGGRVARFPSVGRISGDWGGGGFLSEEALWWAARAEDGRGEPTDLARALPAHFGLPSMYALIEALHLGRLGTDRRHELTPVLFEVADAGDAVARRLVLRQAEEVVALATVALDQLGLTGRAVPVVLGGGVLAARHPLLDDRIRQLLAERASKAVPRVVSAPPVLGSALLGLDRTGAAPGAYRRLRDHYGTPPPG